MTENTQPSCKLETRTWSLKPKLLKKCHITHRAILLDCWRLDAGLLAFRCRTAGFQMPDSWLLDAGLLTFRCRTAGVQMPDCWPLDAGLLAFKCRTAGFQMPDCWLLDAGLLAFRCRTLGFQMPDCWLQMPDCWLEVSSREVLRPATSTQVFLDFPVSISKC